MLGICVVTNIFFLHIFVTHSYTLYTIFTSHPSSVHIFIAYALCNLLDNRNHRNVYIFE